MKCIVFIIVFLNTFSNTFAWGFNYDCTDISFLNIEFTSNHQVAVTVHGPQRVSISGHVPCCLQQGPMIIGNYRFYKDKDNLKDLIATIWKGRQWVNGYSENNSVDPNDCAYGSHTDCDKVYQGAIEYKRADYFDPSIFPSPGESVIIAMDVFSLCF
ncbi:unnamed protein product [Rhizophagus irregularis]|uniref:Uncharacterized protein n=1 Tax=Rhizophagus irregularis TaxID=588596 RepID=A0A2N1MVB9_9GLOM|nr:hypothetical protein RhiirC2_785943 [Rhizophagus irregularis]CAB4380730.1 unnamed protein product [Rhizophagus irregularis]CAB5366165.1 unnamed protein product [Rhizophagus irregularis]